MRITASQIAHWATTKAAQVSLPRLVRRLIHAVEKPQQAAFPAGDSTARPGWDGELQLESGNAWAPAGTSFWEFSCNAKPTEKANTDYKKRTHNTSKSIRSKSMLVMLTARRWSTKDKWRKEKQKAKQWRNVFAYDADDIEQWLEQVPAVALEFGEELGLHGPGVQSLTNCWAGWAEQSSPKISREAFFSDRQHICNQLLENIQRKFATGQPATIGVKADSVDEAAAFVCGTLLASPQISAVSLAVSSANGWNYVAQNPNIKVTVSVRPEFAEQPTHRNGLLVIIPYASGDMVSSYSGAAGRDRTPDVTISRPRALEFEQALQSLGVDEGEAKKLANSTGRSWSVFRRRRATNPALRRPSWCSAPQARALATLCLLGGWSASKQIDRNVVAEVAGRHYEEVERDLLYLAKMDDAPVLQIGDVWKAKSSLELLNLYGDQITREELDRFFLLISKILSMPDPQLDLPESDRHAAQIYGKVRSESKLLLESLCDSLPKLSVRGAQIQALAAARLEDRVATLVQQLLGEAADVRWLSLDSFLPDLAEAAPETFLTAIETSLTKPNSPVRRLLTETGESSFMGRCWHAHLLWALERLAWAPQRLARVSLILAPLSKAKIKGNWGNSPLATLLNIYRSWCPQTAASMAQRIEVIDMLIMKEPDVAFDLLHGLVHCGTDSASPAARPVWRDEDVGAGHVTTNNEALEMVIAAANRLIKCSAGNPYRIARVIEKLRAFDADRIQAILTLANHFANPTSSDEEREIVRTELRKHIHWHRNYDKLRGTALDNKLKPVEDIYNRLTPTDLVFRHRWLFIDGYPDLPIRVRDGDIGRRLDLREKWRQNALEEIYTNRGLPGIKELAESCTPHSQYIGFTLSKLTIEMQNLAEWISEQSDEFVPAGSMANLVWGLLRTLTASDADQLITSVLEKAKTMSWVPSQIARFLIQAPARRTTWNFASSCTAEVDRLYWSTVSADLDTKIDKDDSEFFFHKLLQASRPRTALRACYYDVERVGPHLLAEMLEHFVAGEEPDGVVPDSGSLCEALDALEESGVIQTNRLVQLEFRIIPALGYQGEHHAKSLYDALLNDPKVFTDLLCILYKPHHSEQVTPPSDYEQTAARIAWRLLHNCSRLPGSKRDGTIDAQALKTFIQEARKLAGEADRITTCDINLGEILAHSPAGADGIWPFEPARDILDSLEAGNLRRGFCIGTLRKRGVTSRSLDEGGIQERDLASKYRRYAQRLQNTHPHLAAVIEDVARSYDRQGESEDLLRQLRYEGH